MFETPESRWRAVQTRCPSSSSAFVYAVLTTRIFCRPTCPARLARRANVAFYDTPDEAVHAGFRACKRCRPEQEEDAGEQHAQQKAVAKACSILEREGGLMSWRDVAKEVGLSPRYLHAAFKNVKGVTPGSYAAKTRRSLQEAETKTSRHNLVERMPCLQSSLSEEDQTAACPKQQSNMLVEATAITDMTASEPYSNLDELIDWDTWEDPAFWDSVAESDLYL